MSSAILSRMAASHAKPAVSFLATAVVVTALTTTAPQDQAAPASVFNKPLALPTVAAATMEKEGTKRAQPWYTYLTFV